MWRTRVPDGPQAAQPAPRAADREVVRPPSNRLPSPRALAIGAVVLAIPGIPWLHARSVRHGVEARAGAVASRMTNRTIAVHCPGPLARRLMYEIHEGEVRFDADGVPADSTKLSAGTCDGLRTIFDRGPLLDFSCLKWTCDRDTLRAAQSLAVLVHETMHLRGTRDEGVAECQARHRVAEVAQSLGISPDNAQAIAYWQANDWLELLPPQYNGTC
jgi:hypothetical protein